MRIRVGNSNLEIRKIKVLPAGRIHAQVAVKRKPLCTCARRQTPHAQNRRPRQPESGSDVYAPALLEKLATASASVL